MTLRPPSHERPAKGAEENDRSGEPSHIGLSRALARDIVNVQREDFKPGDEPYAIEDASRMINRKPNEKLRLES